MTDDKSKASMVGDDTSGSQTGQHNLPIQADANPNPHSDQEKGAENVAEPTPASRLAHGIAWFLIVSSILIANFLFAMDNAVAANIQPAVIIDFQALDKLVWLPVAFFAASWGTNFLWGDLYARFSAKWTFCSSFLTFAVGCAVCGAAPTMDALIVGRAICGMGGAGMYFGSMALLTQMTTERERPLYLNLVGITFGGGTVLGPIIGGAFAVSSATWRWAFYFNLVVGAVCAPVYLFLLPTLNPRPNDTMKQRAAEIDYLGLLLLCGLILSILMAISFGGVQYPWGSGRIIALFVLSGTLLMVFLAQQKFAIGTYRDRCMFPLHFFRSSTMVVLGLEVACAATCVFVPVYFLPLYFQFVKADTAITAGVRMLPFVCFQTVITILSGWAVGKTGYYVPWYIFAGALCIPGAAMLYTADQYTNLGLIYGAEVLLGLGSGASTQLSFSVVSMKVPPAQISHGIAWEAFAQLGGPTIALSIANSIFLNKATREMANLLPNYTPLEISTIISDPSSPLLRDLPVDVQASAVDNVVSAMSNAFIMCMIGDAAVLLLIFRFKVNSKLYG